MPSKRGTLPRGDFACELVGGSISGNANLVKQVMGWRGTVRLSAR